MTGHDVQNHRSTRAVNSRASSSSLVVALLVAVAAVLLAYSLYTPSDHDGMWAVIRNETLFAMPRAYHARHRWYEYVASSSSSSSSFAPSSASPSSFTSSLDARDDRYFFQWWNYLLADSKSRHPYQILLQLTHHTETFAAASAKEKQGIPRDYALFAIKHGDLQGSFTVPMHRVVIAADMDVEFHSEPDAGNSTYFARQRAIDDETYLIEGYVPLSHASEARQQEHSAGGIRFSFTLMRVFGAYSGLDRESSNRKAGMCTVISVHFAYHSGFSGYWNVTNASPERASTQNMTRVFDSSSPARAYGAGSFGCQLPAGRPAVSYPWTWAWVAVPSSSSSSSVGNPEIGICLGTARLDGSWLLGDIYGGYSLIGVKQHDSNSLAESSSPVVSISNFARIHTNTMIEMPLTATSNDGYLSRFNVTLSDWRDRHDRLGDARLPLVQYYEIETKRFLLQITLAAKDVDNFFRAPVLVEDSRFVNLSSSAAHLALFSDFRACNVDVHVHLMHANNQSTIYQGPARMNAVEYAYQAPLNVAIADAIEILHDAG